jgi:hypothetical protein
MPSLANARPGDEVWTKDGRSVGFVSVANEREITIELELRGVDKPLRIIKSLQRTELASVFVPVRFIAEQVGSTLYLKNPLGGAR